MSENGRAVRESGDEFRPTIWDDAEQAQQGQQQQSAVVGRSSPTTIPSVTSPRLFQNQAPVNLPTDRRCPPSSRWPTPRRRSAAIPITPRRRSAAIPICRPPAPSSTTLGATTRREAEARDGVATIEEEDQRTSETPEANELNTVLIEDSPTAGVTGQPAQTQVSTLNAAAESFVFQPAQSMVVPPSIPQLLDLDQRMQKLHHVSPLVMTHQPGHGLASVPIHLPRPAYAETAAQILARATRTIPATATAPETHVLPAPTENRTILPAVSGLIRLGVGHVQPVFPGELKDDSLTQHMQQLARFGNADVVWTIYTDGRGYGRLARPDEIALGGGDRGQNGSRVYYHFSPSISPRNSGGHAMNTVDLYLESIALTMWVTRFEMDMSHIITTYLVARPAIMAAINNRIREQHLSPILDQVTHRLRGRDAPDPNKRLANHNTGAMRALRDVWMFTVKLISDGANHGVRSVELPGVHKMLKAMNHLMEYMTLLESEMARVMQTPGAQELVDAYMANGLTVEQLREFEAVAADVPDFRPENLELMRAVTAHFGVALVVRLREVVVLRPCNHDFETPLPFGRPVERAPSVSQNDVATRSQTRPTGNRPRERLTDDQFRAQALRVTPGELSVLAAAHHRQQRSGLRSKLWNGSQGPPPICNPFALVRVDMPVDNQDEAAQTVADATP